MSLMRLCRFYCTYIGVVNTYVQDHCEGNVHNSILKVNSQTIFTLAYKKAIKKEYAKFLK